MDHLAVAAIAAWLELDEIPIAAIMIAMNDSEPRWPYKPFKRFGTRKLVDVFADEEDGGFLEEYFEFYTRFKKDEVWRLAASLELPTRFAIDERGAYARTESLEESLVVFLWRAAYLIPLAYLMTYFGNGVWGGGDNGLGG